MYHLKTVALLATLTALLVWVGQALAGHSGFVVALLLAGCINLGAYWWSDKLVLRMYGAEEVQEAQAPGLWMLIRDLAHRASLPMPRVYIIPEDAPNAFATGRNPHHAAVAVTRGLLHLLDHEELAGVIAHELAHVKHRDTLLMTVAATLAGALSMLANAAMWGAMFGSRSSDDEEHGHPLAGLLGVLIAPLAATLIQLAISRSREFVADEMSARLTGAPLHLAKALRKLAAWSSKVPMTTGSPATAHLFIVNPFTGGSLARWFSTHPSTEARVARLETMARHSVVGHF